MIVDYLRIKREYDDEPERLKIEFLYEPKGLTPKELQELSKDIYFLDYINNVKEDIKIDLERLINAWRTDKEIFELKYKCKKIKDILE